MNNLNKIQSFGISLVAALFIHIGTAAHCKIEACYLRSRNKSFMLIQKGKKKVASKSKFIKGIRSKKVEQRQAYTPANIAITLF